MVFSFLIIKTNGFPKRFEKLKEINNNYNPDNFSLSQNRMGKFNKDKKFNKGNYNILLVGDSFAEDLFNALNLTRSLYNKVDFFFFDLNYSSITSDELFKNSNMVIYSYDWNISRFKDFEKNLKKIMNLNSNIAITSSSNEYKVHSGLYTLLDYKILFEGKNFDYYGLKKLYFNNRLVHSNTQINKDLKNLAIKNNLIYLNREDYMCEVLNNKCDYVDNKGTKLLYDYGHYTKDGAKFFGNKIYKMNWLQLN